MPALIDRNPLDGWPWWNDQTATTIYPICEDLLSHRVSSAEAARVIVATMEKANPLFADFQHEDFTDFCELVGATLHLPVGPSRKHWIDSAVIRKDREIRLIEDHFRERIEVAARRILAKRNSP